MQNGASPLAVDEALAMAAEAVGASLEGEEGCLDLFGADLELLVGELGQGAVLRSRGVLFRVSRQI